MKKIYICIVGGMTLALTACSEITGMQKEVQERAEFVQADNQINKQEYPRMVYIDNVLYYDTEKKCDAVPRKMPDGIIETYVEKEIMPDSFNSANFGSEKEQIEYMYLEDKRLIVHIDENWYYFDIQEENVEQ